MTKLLIAGAGMLGRIVYQWTQDEKDWATKWASVTFLDDNLNALDQFGLSTKIENTIMDYRPKDNEVVVCALGTQKIRSRIYKELLDKGAAFTEIIHPRAFISGNCLIGRGALIFPGAYVFTNATVGEFTVINSLTTVGHDATIGNNCILSAHCDVMGNAKLEEEVFLGSGARILPYVRVGRRARVGAGSVVLRNVKENTSVFGNPAKTIYNPGVFKD